VQEIEAENAALHKEVAELRRQVTESGALHSEVAELRRQVAESAELHKEVAELRRQLAEAAPPSSSAPNVCDQSCLTPLLVLYVGTE
jgi:DnaJ-domain-containing protein 1